jgi:hypothetical protein
LLAALTVMLGRCSSAAAAPEPPRPLGFLRVAGQDGGNGLARVVDSGGRTVSSAA